MNSVAQAAAVASLDAEDELLERVETVVKERDAGPRGAARGRLDRARRPRRTSSGCGWASTPPPSPRRATRPGSPSARSPARALAISIGTPAANDAFLAAGRCVPVPDVARPGRRR